MRIEKIFIAQKNASQAEQQTVRVEAGLGLQGDRYRELRGNDGSNVTFVEAEVLEAFAHEYGRAVDLSISRRNIVTRGVSLNALVDKEFTVGGVRFIGVELCEPCSKLGKSLASAELSAPAVVKFFVHRGGLRARALSGGELSVGSLFSQ